MLLQVVKFVRLPIVLLFIYAVGRFLLGAYNVPYAPRGNATFSVVGLTFISSVYFGALSGKVGKFNWVGTILIGLVIGLSGQIFIFTATLISYLANIETSYYRHWDALNVPEGTIVPMAQAMRARVGGLIFGPISAIIATLIGRLLGFLVSEPES